MEIGEDSRKIINRMNNVEPVGGNAKGPRDGEGEGTGREEGGVEGVGEGYEGEGRLGEVKG